MRYTQMYGGHHPWNPSPTTNTMPLSLTTTHVTLTSLSYARRMRLLTHTSTWRPGYLLNITPRSSVYVLIEGGSTLIKISQLTFKPREPNIASPHMTPPSTMGLLKPLIIAFSSTFVLCSIKADFLSFCGGKLCYRQTGSRTECQHVHSII